MPDDRSPPVPAPAADDVHLGGEEPVRRPDDGPDVQVVAEVLDGPVEGVPAPFEVGHDRVEGPVAVAVDHVAPVAVREEFRIQPRILRPGADPRADTHVLPPLGRPRGPVRAHSQSIRPPCGAVTASASAFLDSTKSGPPPRSRGVPGTTPPDSWAIQRTPSLATSAANSSRRARSR